MLKTPPLQTATATIDTLCGRLASATLLEDRRAAILGLRSFAKQYPASVASGSLRELITTLRRDGLGEAASPRGKSDRRPSAAGSGDVDTIRLVLETLLMLFKPDANSPEASDEIAFFMADEFSMRQDNIALLLNLLDPTSPYADYYSRLYSVNLLSAICAARPERLQECVLSAPLGTSRLVGVLDDTRDAVRNAGLLLLVDLTGGASEELRKIVAFEDVFAKVFALIRLEGGLADAGITGQDCLSLLANLTRGSASNQTMFRESGCVGQLMQLLREIFPPSTPSTDFAADTREKAGWGLLQLFRFFLVSGEASTPQNQLAFFRAGAAQILLDLAFHDGLPVPLRVLAFQSTAGLISNNQPLQEQLAGLQVAVATADKGALSPSAPQTNGSRSAPHSAKTSARTSVERPRTYIIEALLELTLKQSTAETSLRAAACALIQAYLGKHDRIKAHFLQRAISGHESNETGANALISLLQPDLNDHNSIVFASWIAQDLVVDITEAKAAFASIKEGGESEDEDVLTAIQSLGSSLEGLLQSSGNGTTIIAYTSLLTVLLWEFAAGIDDLLAEGSSLIQALVNHAGNVATSPVTAGAAAVLLGTIYEFSTKDSPIPRRTLAPLLTQKLTRAKYLAALQTLRQDPAVRDFDLYPADAAANGLDATYVDLFQTEYSRLRKAIDKDPGLEVLPSSASEAGVDRDILDELRQQITGLSTALAAAQQNAQDSMQTAEQERLSLQKEAQTASAEVERLRRINQAMQAGHEEDSQRSVAQKATELEALNLAHSRTLAGLRQDAEKSARSAREQAEQAAQLRIQELERRLVELGNAHRTEQSGHETKSRELQNLTEQHAGLQRNLQQTNIHFQTLQTRNREVDTALQQERSRAEEVSAKLASANEAHAKALADAARAEEALKEVREELQGRDAELATERAGFADLEAELESLKTALTTAQKDLAVAKTAASTSSADADDTATLKKELAAAKEAEKAAKEELDSMLLVLADIEAERDDFKAKVKELGGDVGSEEDDEDEDADGVDEEDGEEDEDDKADVSDTVAKANGKAAKKAEDSDVD
ncbi:hypothetical protein B0A48_00006 [Cryoendolithus antarcticus]|uniref:Vesicle tethering protein Uso1/P115-like head domain-containing protein n=1 Tax=Cryoendolithus antarcticus TaxID=1507870 RepID=A0A1V8TTA0_9PEZI|nr:hypothetical protein B0A48_00006 [Cryoendolithus antarcticus]